MGHLKNLIRYLRPNPFIKDLKNLKSAPKLLLFWNRGLGDIPLEIYPLLELIKKYAPNSFISIITRADLYEGFTLLGANIKIYVSTNLERKKPEDVDKIFEELELNQRDFDRIWIKPDPAYWAKKIKKNLKIHLTWQDQFFKKHTFITKKPLAVLHIHSETVYGFEKNLPPTSWHHVIENLKQKGYYTLALGFSKNSGNFDVDCDLRGQTTLYDVLSLVIDYEPLFIGPDSGLLNMLYYLDTQKPLYLISFWANPKVGLLKQNTPSSNGLLKHELILAPDEQLHALDPRKITDKIPSVAHLKHLYLDEKPLTFNQALYLQNDLEAALKKLSLFKEPLRQNIDLLDNPDIEVLNLPFTQDPRLMPILLAGGHGTRLEFEKPKALFEIQGLSLLGHFAKKIKKASSDFNKPLKACVIVSKEGYFPILEHLKQHAFFGLQSDQLRLIIQNNLPFVTQEDQLVLKTADSLYEGPNGNGEVFKLLKDYKIFEQLEDSILGFEIIPIDNPLAPLFNKSHAECFDQGYEMTLITVKCHEEETLGKIAKSHGQICVVEYSENPPKHLMYGNTGLLGFSKQFAQTLCEKTDLPLHVATKSYSCFTGQDFKTLTVKKFETFIFDHLKWAQKVKVFCSEKKGFFQPLKQKLGTYGVEALEQALNDVEMLNK